MFIKNVRTAVGVLVNTALIGGIIVITSNYIEANRDRWEHDRFVARICGPDSQDTAIPADLKCLFVRKSTDTVSAPLLAAVAWQESRFKPWVCSPAGACGLMQFMPATAKDYNVRVFDVESSVNGAVRYLTYLQRRFNDNLGLALAAYNWGQGNVQRWKDAGANSDRMPKETRDYVLAITGKTIDVWTGKITGSRHVTERNHYNRMWRDIFL